MFALQVKSKVFFIQFKKKMGQFLKIESDKVGIMKLHIHPKVTKMGSIIGQRIVV